MSSENLAAREMRLLGWLFFASGFAALLYQIVWQRTLFSLYGINVESVTMIVTVFMVGLGVGSLTGGVVSRSPKRDPALLFAIAEGAIGVYGLASLSLYRAIGAATLHFSPLGIGLTTFAMILVPTTLMGATLPLLVAHFTRISKKVGESVGSLYHLNTLGAAAGALVGGVFLLGALGQTGTLRVAAALNFVASALCWTLVRRRKSAGARSVP